ncbi:hypothetical protein EJ08DRAFT_693509 [Tothia fuscella]|uniref:Uncharacterized protein n=1 Tax=Tothia fuscella TaxID=1048955 RepID=A0A9P4P016_9PEZI|nr:hypothetical protein EJ08DRAFT_693509 [Tothia fuscella]
MDNREQLLDTDFLRLKSATEMALYFLQCLKTSSDQDITTSLFRLAEQEAISPVVVHIWLCVSKSPQTLQVGLRHKNSVSIRTTAIKRLAKLWASKSWERVWEGLGGTPGWLSLLATFSVLEVQIFVREMRRVCRRGPDIQQRGEKISCLLKGLLPSFYTDADHKTSDERPVIDGFGHSLYAPLLPACDSAFVDEVLQSDQKIILKHQQRVDHVLLTAHYELLQFYCIHANTRKRHQLQQYLKPLMKRYPGIRRASGYSESMAFSLDLLHKLVADPKSDLGDGTSTTKSLIEPLVKRAWTRRLKVGAEFNKLISLCLNFFETHQSESKNLNFEQNGLLYFLVLSWAHSPSDDVESESNLVSLLKKMPYDSSNLWSNTINLFSWVREPLRYLILKFVLLHNNPENIDLDVDDDLKRLDVGLWPQEIFQRIGRDNALQLLRQLQRVRGDEFLRPDAPSQSSILQSRSSFGDLITLFGVIGDTQPAKNDLENRQKTALRERDQGQRANAVESAVICAIATGSLEIYGKTIEWAKRYIKDPLTARTVFARNIINSYEAISLLTGIWSSDGLDVSQISFSIAHANKNIIAILELIQLAKKEPFYNERDWEGVQSLFSDVVNLRVRRTARLQTDHKLSDEDLYEIVWSETLQVALKIEEQSLQEQHDQLYYYSTKGPVNLEPWTQRKSIALQPCLLFVDNLAKGRDLIWKKFRRSILPAVTTLPPMVPQGLAIQQLVGSFCLHEDWTAGSTPFISSRAQSVIFPTPDDALAPLPDTEETRVAIGPFVDNYTLALRIYVNQCSTHEQRRANRGAAWKYAVEELSKKRMSLSEAHRTWATTFRAAGLEICDADPPTDMKYPLLPYSRHIAMAEEWDPAEAFAPPVAVQSRKLEPTTYLDLCVNHQSWNEPSIGGKVEIPEPVTTGFTPPALQLWNVERLTAAQQMLPSIREGLSVSALLYIDSKIKGRRNILASSFPCKSEPRYQPLYLADELLQRDDININQATKVVKRYSNTIPPTLILQLAKCAFAAVEGEATDSAERTKIEILAFRLLTLSTRSDRPHLAIDLVMQTIMDRPDASSWHRQLVSPLLLNRLPSSYANDVVQKFSLAIQTRLKEQAARPKRMHDDNTPITSSPYIKITTVKLLAQLLLSSNFVSQSFAVEVLVDILNIATHLDIRIAMIATLVDILSRSSDDALCHLIISRLETVIYISGDLNESMRLSEEEWIEARLTKSPPEVIIEFEGTTRTWGLPPLLEVVLKLSGERSSVRNEWRNEVIHRVLLPLIEQSIASNTRWLKIFAAKYGVDLDSLKIPMLPAYPRLLFQVLQYCSWEQLPPALLVLQHQFIMTNLIPSQQLSKFNLKFKDPAIRKLAEVQHWASLYGRGTEICNSARSSQFLLNDLDLPNILYDWDDSEHQKGILLPEVRKSAFEQAQALLWHHLGDGLFAKYMEGFRRQLKRGEEPQRHRLGLGQPVVEKIIEYIDHLRTPQWQQSSAREPPTLPSTLKYRLWLLPYPPSLRKGARPDKRKIKAFVHDFYILVKETCANNRPYHKDLPLLRNAVLEVLPYYRADVACGLGELKPELRLEDLLAIELAQALFEHAAPSRDDAVCDEARKTIKSWRQSEVEFVRLKGQVLAKKASYEDKVWMRTLLGKDGMRLNLDV